MTGVGFWLLGSPQKQRQIRLDQQRIQDLAQIARSLHQQAQPSLNQDEAVELPATLPPSISKTDPVSDEPYSYERLNSTRYQLCAEFATDSDDYRLQDLPDTRDKFWTHPTGRHCFELNVLENPPPHFRY